MWGSVSDVRVFTDESSTVFSKWHFIIQILHSAFVGNLNHDVKSEICFYIRVDQPIKTEQIRTKGPKIYNCEKIRDKGAMFGRDKKD